MALGKMETAKPAVSGVSPPGFQPPLYGGFVVVLAEIDRPGQVNAASDGKVDVQVAVEPPGVADPAMLGVELSRLDRPGQRLQQRAVDGGQRIFGAARGGSLMRSRREPVSPVMLSASGSGRRVGRPG